MSIKVFINFFGKANPFCYVGKFGVQYDEDTKLAKKYSKGVKKAAKATKKATTKIKRSPSKKVSSQVNKKPKTVAAKPIRTAPKVQSKAKVKVTAKVKPKKTIKTSVAPKPKRNTVVLRVGKTRVIKASKGSPKGGSSTAGKSSSSNKQIMENSADDVVGDKVVDNTTPKHSNRNIKDIDAYDDIENFLGKGEQTDINPFTGKTDKDRIFVKQKDGSVRALRFGNHEMSNPKNLHYHLEQWDQDGNFIRPDQSVKVNNTRRKR